MGRSGAEKRAERAQEGLMQEQQKLEQQQDQEQKVQRQELLKRKLAALRGDQAANALGGISNPSTTSGGLSNTLG